MNLLSVIFLLILSFLPSIFWLFFYYYYSPRFTTPRRFLLLLFFLGMGAAGVAAIVERGFFAFLPRFILESIEPYFWGTPFHQFPDILLLFLVMFLFIAPVEEGFKFAVIKIALTRKQAYLDQVIDGIKFGVVTGLGFAVVENGIYFAPSLLAGERLLLLKLFLLRLFFSTLGHSLYTGILGYYFALSRAYRLYARNFLLWGLFSAISIHAIFNFLLLIDLGFFSIAVLLIMLLLMLKWYQDRKSLENALEQKRPELVRSPTLMERIEFESVLAQNKITFDFIKRLHLCPFCLKAQDPKKRRCSSCGRIFRRSKSH